MKKVFLSLILVFTTVMGMAQSLDISYGGWTIDSLKKENVDTILVDATSCPALGMGTFNENHKLRRVLSMLGIDAYRAPDGNRLHNYLLYSLPAGNIVNHHYSNYVYGKTQKKEFKILKENLKNTVVVFYVIDVDKGKILLDENIVI